MNPGTLAAILASLASILGTLSAILHSRNTRKMVRRHHSGQTPRQPSDQART